MRRAFTLVELMVVIAIIAVIAAIVIPNLTASGHLQRHKHRYLVDTHNGSNWYYTDTIVRLPDGGVSFVTEQGNTIEVHGTFTITDYQAPAEAR